MLAENIKSASSLFLETILEPVGRKLKMRIGLYPLRVLLQVDESELPAASRVTLEDRVSRPCQSSPGLTYISVSFTRDDSGYFGLEF